MKDNHFFLENKFCALVIILLLLLTLYLPMLSWEKGFNSGFCSGSGGTLETFRWANVCKIETDGLETAGYTEEFNIDYSVEGLTTEQSDELNDIIVSYVESHNATLRVGLNFEMRVNSVSAPVEIFVRNKL